MAQLPSFDPYDFLVSRKYPGCTGREITECTEQSSPGGRSALRKPQNALEAFATPRRKLTPVEEATLRDRNTIKVAAARYRSELLLLSAEQITAQVNDARAAAARQAEQNLVFNRSDAQADFEHYCRAAIWTLEECVALSLGKNPMVVNWKTIAPHFPYYPFARQYERRRELCTRALAVQQLTDPVYPTNFLAWAKETKLELPKELTSAAVNQGISLRGWKDLYEEQAIETAELKKQLSEARREIEAQKSSSAAATKPSTSRSPSVTRERNTLLKLVIGMAIQAYRYDPRRPRNSATADIRNDLDGLGLPVDDGTILKYLTEASPLIDFENLPPNLGKPNSVKR